MVRPPYRNKDRRHSRPQLPGGGGVVPNADGRGERCACGPDMGAAAVPQAVPEELGGAYVFLAPCLRRLIRPLRSASGPRDTFEHICPCSLFFFGPILCHVAQNVRMPALYCLPPLVYCVKR